MIIAYLERHNDEKNMHRFYRLAIYPTLFGEYALVREWGRCTSRPTYGKRGQRKEEWFAQEAEAQAAAEKLKTSKCKKGYQLRLFG
jgi:predicted DNA-binding WGR domain protein